MSVSSKLVCVVPALVGLIVGLCGCESVPKYQNTLADLHARGDYAGACKVLEDPKAREVYGQKDIILWSLEHGASQLAGGDCVTAKDTFEKAEGYTAYNYNLTKGNVLAQWALNDTAAPYMAQPYEDMYVNVFKQIAYLRAGDREGAVVESNRLLDKAQSLGRVTEEYLHNLQNDKRGKVLTGADSQIHTENAGTYVTTPLGAYLATLVFAKAGNSEGQRIGSARLRQAIGEQQAFVGNVDSARFDGIGSSSAAQNNVVVVAFSGRSARKEALKVSFPFAKDSVSVPFPKMKAVPSLIAGARVEVNGGDSTELDMVEDIGSVVVENYKRTESLIYTRTAIRIAIKAGIVAGATYGVHQGTKSDTWAALTAIGGLLVVAYTEEADLRSWVMLPGRAHVTALQLPPGEHEVRVVYRYADGTDHPGAWTKLNVQSTELRPLVTFDPH